MVKTLVLGPLCANCHIVTDENGVGFVVDPGANAWKIFPELKGLDIKYVIFTHEHYDHIMAASEVMEKTGAKLVASRFTAENIHDRDKTLLCWFPGVKNELPDVDIDTLTDLIWTNLNADNKVSLFVRYIDIATGEADTRIVNKNV